MPKIWVGLATVNGEKKENGLITYKKKIKNKLTFIMSIFISDKDTATLCVQLFLDQNNPKSKYKGKNEFIYITYVEAVQKIRSPVLSG